MNPDNFVDRYAMCPLCLRDNVRIRDHAGNVVLDEHPMGIVVVAHSVPIDPGTRDNRCATDTYARVRCPASLAPLMPLEGS